MSLTAYKKKRNFGNTPEPAATTGKRSKKLSFVIQRHDASHLHYDFRLEVAGVLKSWAVPKGPSLDPSDKRLAVMVEDHPLTYGKFAGEIPEGNYGAGSVEIWDRGYYEPEVKATDPDKEIEREIAKGSVKFVLHGEQLNGSFALVSLKNSDKNWLLIKHNDEFAETKYSIEDHPSVVATGQKNHKATPPSVKKTKAAHAAVPASVRSLTEKVSDATSPMLATPGDSAFDDDHWVFEIKWDGYRAVAEVGTRKPRLYSRNGLSFLSLYQTVAAELEKIKVRGVIDGEIVALDDEGKPSFQLLQNNGQQAASLVYYVFDCLSFDGKDLRGLPLLERKKFIKKIIPARSHVLRYSDHVTATGVSFFNEVVKKGLEGMMAKRADSIYSSGKRTHDWLKIKNQNTQEAVIAGFTAPRNSRKHFGALVLGMYKHDVLTFIGHTGTGFTEALLTSVSDTLKPLIQKSSPFDKPIPMREKVTWVKPVEVCNVKFSEVTKEGILRHPVFMGLRIDKPAKEVDHLDTSAADKKISERKSKTKNGTKKKLAGRAEDGIVIGKDAVRVTHPDKIFWPDEGITKGDVVEYYRSVARYILPYLKNRPESLKRNPGGISDKGFFHKDAARTAPGFVDHIPLYSEGAKKEIDYVLCNNEATLVWLNNLGCIEINPWNSKVSSLDNPDYLILDIDPSDKNNFDQVVDVTHVIGELLKKAGAKGYPKTSGATGMHVYIPLHAKYSYDQVRIFAEGLAHMVVEQLPETTTIERSLSGRRGRIYVDYLQNKRGQTLSAVYSLRPVPGATVSTPLEWKEVRHGLSPSSFDIHNTVSRIKKKGDLFGGVLKESVDLKKCIKNLGF